MIVLILIATVYLLPKLVLAQSIDSDGDGLSDIDEKTIYATDPNVVDTDGDGYPDGVEIARRYSPRHVGEKKLVDADSDGDGLNDDWELKIGASILNPDTDGDGYQDGEEVMNGYDPLLPQPIKTEKKITVNLAKQHLTYTFGGVALDDFPISSGVARMPTPKGSFSILEKFPVKYYFGENYSYPNTKWNLHFATGKLGRFYIHGAYWHNKFGKPMSHGCVNVAYANMERLYDWATVGTPVVIE